MSAFTQSHVAISYDYAEFLDSARLIGVPDLEFREPPLESVAEYGALNERVPPGFPRPDDHFVIADYMIDLPVVAVDLSSESSCYGRVIAYSYDEFWVLADSLQGLVISMRRLQEAALFGRSEET